MTSKKTTGESPSFEATLAQLSDIVRQLEEGDLTLDESLAQYELGIRHLSQCQKMLAAAEQKILRLHGFDADGNAVTHRFDEGNLSLDEKAQQRSRRRSASAGQSVQESNEQTERNTESDDVDLGGTLF